MPQDKKQPRGLYKAKKSNPITAKRAYEVSDSLMNQAGNKKYTAAIQRNMGNAAIKKGFGDKQFIVDKFLTTLSGKDRVAIADKLSKEASSDSSNAVRYRALADKAIKNKKK